MRTLARTDFKSIYSRTVASRMEFFVITINGWETLIIDKKFPSQYCQTNAFFNEGDLFRFHIQVCGFTMRFMR